MSPELLERKAYNVKTDIWALGCSIYELATFSTPYEAPNMDILLNKIRNGLPQRIDKTYSDELWNIISKMLTYDYNKRPSSMQLIEDCCEIFILKNRFNRNYYQKKLEELAFYNQQLNKKDKELQKKDEEQREKEKMISYLENSLNIKANNLKMKEQELNNKVKELEEMYKKFEEKKKELNIKEMQIEKEIKMKEFNIKKNININQENLALNNNR
jgi:serine/threonine protein kinase